jgi:uncharacterized protein
MVASFTPTDPPQALSDADVEQLQSLLDQVPAPLQPLDVSALDGYLCGLLLQPNDVAATEWLPGVTDVDARPLPQGFDGRALFDLVMRRHAQLDQAIGARQWFDPWIFELDAQASPSETVLPWIAGFAAAMERFPGLMDSGSPELLEPLGLLYLHFAPEDLEDAEALQAMIETLEPPADLGEAVQDIVRSLMLMADVTRPRSAPRARGRSHRGTPRASNRR